jgi:hypothetical protein
VEGGGGGGWRGAPNANALVQVWVSGETEAFEKSSIKCAVSENVSKVIDGGRKVSLLEPSSVSARAAHSTSL